MIFSEILKHICMQQNYTQEHFAREVILKIVKRKDNKNDRRNYYCNNWVTVNSADVLKKA